MIAPISGRRGLDPVHPPDERGDGGGVRVLRQQLVGVDEQHRRGGDDGVTASASDRPGAAADDAVDEHQPDAERRHLDELQAVVVEAPEVDERRQQERPAPRVGDRAERPPELITVNRLSATTWAESPSNRLRAWRR